MRRKMSSVLGPGLALALWLGGAPAGAATSRAADAPLVVGTMAMPPFVVHEPDGRWTGTAIELWRTTAEELGVRFEFAERDLEGLFVGLEDGSLDVSVAALTVTADRERRVDFTHPYFTTGLAIALDHERAETWYDPFLAVLSPTFVRLILLFAGLQLAVGALMWQLERRRNPGFHGSPVVGVTAGLWWAVVTMATVGYGDKVPITPAGRLLAMLWMLASLIILTTVTASITTSLTLGRLESKVTGPGDLGKLRVGAVSQTTSEETLREMKLDFRSMPDLHSGLAAICRHELDAMVDDQPMLAMTVEAGYAGCIDVLPHTFHRQDYAFALPTGSALREPINRILASRVATLQSP